MSHKPSDFNEVTATPARPAPSAADPPTSSSTDAATSATVEDSRFEWVWVGEGSNGYPLSSAGLRTWKVSSSVDAAPKVASVSLLDQMWGPLWTQLADRIPATWAPPAWTGVALLTLLWPGWWTSVDQISDEHQTWFALLRFFCAVQYMVLSCVHRKHATRPELRALFIDYVWLDDLGHALVAPYVGLQLVSTFLLSEPTTHNMFLEYAAYASTYLALFALVWRDYYAVAATTTINSVPVKDTPPATPITTTTRGTSTTTSVTTPTKNKGKTKAPSSSTPGSQSTTSLSPSPAPAPSPKAKAPSPPSTASPNPPTTTATTAATKPPATTAATKPPATTAATKPPATTAASKPPATTAATKPPTTTAATKPPTTTAAPKPPTTTATTATTATPKPPTTTATTPAPNPPTVPALKPPTTPVLKPPTSAAPAEPLETQLTPMAWMHVSTFIILAALLFSSLPMDSGFLKWWREPGWIVEWSPSAQSLLQRVWTLINESSLGALIPHSVATTADVTTTLVLSRGQCVVLAFCVVLELYVWNILGQVLVPQTTTRHALMALQAWMPVVGLWIGIPLSLLASVAVYAHLPPDFACSVGQKVGFVDQCLVEAVVEASIPKKPFWKALGAKLKNLLPFYFGRVEELIIVPEWQFPAAGAAWGVLPLYLQTVAVACTLALVVGRSWRGRARQAVTLLESMGPAVTTKLVLFWLTWDPRWKADGWALTCHLISVTVLGYALGMLQQILQHQVQIPLLTVVHKDEAKKSR